MGLGLGLGKSFSTSCEVPWLGESMGRWTLDTGELQRFCATGTKVGECEARDTVSGQIMKSLIYLLRFELNFKASSNQ